MPGALGMQAKLLAAIFCLAALGLYTAFRSLPAPTMPGHVARHTPRIIVVGSGLAGTAAALAAAEAGGPQAQVVVLEKEARPGGNSMKASSGINAMTPESGDSAEAFRADTVKSGGGMSTPELVDTLVVRPCRWLARRPCSLSHFAQICLGASVFTRPLSNPPARPASPPPPQPQPPAPQGDSQAAISWLQSRGIDLAGLVQLGGHTRKRTHTSSRGPVGFSIMKARPAGGRGCAQGPGLGGQRHAMACPGWERHCQLDTARWALPVQGGAQGDGGGGGGGGVRRAPRPRLEAAMLPLADLLIFDLHLLGCRRCWTSRQRMSASRS